MCSAGELLVFTIRPQICFFRGPRGAYDTPARQGAHVARCGVAGRFVVASDVGVGGCAGDDGGVGGGGAGGGKGGGGRLGVGWVGGEEEDEEEGEEEGGWRPGCWHGWEGRWPGRVVGTGWGFG